jgi:hypothetical protein
MTSRPERKVAKRKNRVTLPDTEKTKDVKENNDAEKKRDTRRKQTVSQRHKHVNNWTRGQEEVLKNWGEICQVYARMNYDAHQLFWKRERIIGAMTVFSSAIIGCSGFAIASANVDCEWQRLSTFITSTLMLLVSGLCALYAFLDYAKKANAHRTAYDQYTHLFEEIKIQLVHEKMDRQDGKQFERHILVSLDQVRSGIQNKAPIPESIRQRYFKMMESQQGIAKPDIVDNTIQPLQIHNSSSTSSDEDHHHHQPPSQSTAI